VTSMLITRVRASSKSSLVLYTCGTKSATQSVELYRVRGRQGRGWGHTVKRLPASQSC
jgi:hypothetical protein